MTIHERFKAIRKAEGLSLARFGERIGYDQGTISKIENARPPYDERINEKIILAVIKEYRVCEVWLRTGEGPMYIEHPSSGDPSEERVRWALSLFSQLCQEDQKKILEIARELVRVGEKKEIDLVETDAPAEIRRRKSA